MKPKELTADSVWREYEKMLTYNDSIQLDDTVRVNENFFIGKQWEGVESNGLPTPQFNFLKRVTLFTVASITSDKLKLQCSPLPSGAGDRGLRRAADVINAEFEALFEHNKLTWLLKEYISRARARRLHHRPPGPHKRHHRPPRRRGRAVGPDRMRGESTWKRTPFRPPPPRAGSGR